MDHLQIINGLGRGAEESAGMNPRTTYEITQYAAACCRTSHDTRSIPQSVLVSMHSRLHRSSQYGINSGCVGSIIGDKFCICRSAINCPTRVYSK